METVIVGVEVVEVVEVEEVEVEVVEVNIRVEEVISVDEWSSNYPLARRAQKVHFTSLARSQPSFLVNC
jgi:hypothetical protein